MNGSPVRIERWQLDDSNEAEMAAHGVRPTELEQILDGGAYRILRNRSGRGEPYVVQGRTSNGRVLHIPSRPTMEDPLAWRPATAYDPSPHQYRR